MCTLVLTPQLSFNMSPLANEMGKYVFGEPVMIVGADVTHWAKGYVSSLVHLSWSILVVMCILVVGT